MTSPPSPTAVAANNNAGTHRVSFSGDKHPVVERTHSISSASSTRSNASRRSTLPPTLSAAMMTDESTGGGTDNNKSPTAVGGSKQQPPAKRASISGPMMTAQFKTKETARWRPNSMAAQAAKLVGFSSGNITDDKDEMERIRLEQQLKPLREQVFDKTSSSVVIHLIVVAISYVIGTLTNMMFRRDVGYLMFWGNQFAILFSFLQLVAPDVFNNLPSSLPRILSELDAFDQATLAAQTVPLVLFLLWDGLTTQTYATLVKIIVFQACLKLGLMLSGGKLVKVVL